MACQLDEEGLELGELPFDRLPNGQAGALPHELLDAVRDGLGRDLLDVLVERVPDDVHLLAQPHAHADVLVLVLHELQVLGLLVLRDVLKAPDGTDNLGEDDVVLRLLPFKSLETRFRSRVLGRHHAVIRNRRPVDDW